MYQGALEQLMALCGSYLLYGLGNSQLLRVLAMYQGALEQLIGICGSYRVSLCWDAIGICT